MPSENACITGVTGNVNVDDISSTPNNGESNMNNPVSATSFKSPFEGLTKAECISLFVDALTPKARDLYKKMEALATDIEHADLDDLKLIHDTSKCQSCHCPLHAILYDAVDSEMTRRWELEILEKGIVVDDPEAAYDEYIHAPQFPYAVSPDWFRAVCNAMTPNGRRVYDVIESVGLAIEKLSDKDLKRLQRLAMFQSVHCVLYVILHDATAKTLDLRKCMKATFLGCAE